MAYVAKKAMKHDEWVESRRKGIGGSDVGAILGWNPWKTPLDVYREKVEGVRTEDNDAMKAGRMLEDTIAKWYALETGHRVVKDNKIRIHPQHDFLIANLDRLIVGNGNGKGTGILEVKTASGWAFQQWEDDGLPLMYYGQIQHYMNVTGHKWGDFAVLVDGRHLKIIPVEYDKEFCEMMEWQLVKFWEEHIKPQVPPEPVNEHDAKLLWPKEQAAKTIEVSEANYKDVLRLRLIIRAKKRLEERENKIKESLKLMMQDAEALTYAGEKIVTYKATKDRKEFDKGRFQEEHPELYNQYVITKPGHRVFRLNLN